jgi:hypothetical protein
MLLHCPVRTLHVRLVNNAAESEQGPGRCFRRGVDCLRLTESPGAGIPSISRATHCLRAQDDDGRRAAGDVPLPPVEEDPLPTSEEVRLRKPLHHRIARHDKHPHD